METTHDVEATAEEVEEVTATEAAQVAVVEAAPATANAVMMPFDAEEVRTAMEAYQDTVRATLDPSDWQGTPGSRGAFVKKSGWRKIAKAFGLSVTRVEDGVERDAEGNPVRAWAVYRAAHPNGQTQDGDGYCSADESRFARSGGRQKLENDLRATATTRAKNRAISDLVGMGEVSAEEIAVMGTAEPEVFTGDLVEPTAQLAAVVGQETADKVIGWIHADNGGLMPASVGRALVAIGRVLAAQASDNDDDLPF